MVEGNSTMAWKKNTKFTSQGTTTYFAEYKILAKPLAAKVEALAARAALSHFLSLGSKTAGYVLRISFQSAAKFGMGKAEIQTCAEVYRAINNRRAGRDKVLRRDKTAAS